MQKIRIQKTEYRILTSDFYFTMKMKVAIIIERADINLGGAERSVFEIAAAVSELGQDIEILAAKGSRDAKNISILCQGYSGSRTSHSIFAAALKKHLSENHYDIVHSVLPFNFADVYQPRGGTYTESILRNAESYQNKVVASFKRLTAFANFRRTALLQAERELCRAFKDRPIIVAISKYVAEQFRRHYAVGDERIRIIPNGIKIQNSIDRSEINKLRQQIFTRFGIKETDNPVFFLFAANNFRLKGLAVLIKAIRLSARYRTPCPAYLIVAGGNRPRKYFRKDEKIIFLGPIRHIQNILSISDVAILPTFYDPCSRFILEALASGKPVITTKFNGATDLFVNNRHGKVINTPDDITALAEAIIYFSCKENIQKASQAIAADNLKEKISINRVAKQLIELYELILHKKGLK